MTGQSVTAIYDNYKYFNHGELAKFVWHKYL